MPVFLQSFEEDISNVSPDSKWDGVNLFNARETNTVIFLKTR